MVGILARARFAHSSFVVSDLQKASDVLSNVFGFRAVFGPVDVEQELGRITGRSCERCCLAQFETSGGDLTIELVQGSTSGTQGAVPHLAFHVDDLDAALGQILSEGAKIMGEVVTFAEGRAAYVQVPGGLFIELEELF